VTCTSCLGRVPGDASRDASNPLLPALDRGRPGASAGREYRRRRSNREARVRRRHPHIGGLLLALGASPQHERAFEQGRLGEETVARSLERRLAGGPAALLHDRRMPGGYGNIDHLAVAPRGVYVIDAKAIKGKVRVRPGRPGGSRLLQVNGRTRNTLVLGLARQVQAVRTELDTLGCGEVSLTGVLCFTEADFPLLRRMQIDGHLLRHPRALARELDDAGPLTAQAINSLAHRLGARFPPA
jgi:hypothetical protein